MAKILYSLEMPCNGLYIGRYDLTTKGAVAQAAEAVRIGVKLCPSKQLSKRR